MPAELESLINDTDTQMKAIGDIYFDGIYDSMSSLHDWLTAEGCPNSADVVLSMRYYVKKLRDKYSTAVGSYRLRLINTLWWINDNWPEENGEPPYELTAKKICEAWAVNGFQDRALTIAFIDRMRQLIWDEPFYVAWAAKPKL